VRRRPGTAAFVVAAFALLVAGQTATGAAAQIPPPSAVDDAPASLWIHLVEPVDGGDAARARKEGERPATGTLASAPRRRLPDVFGCGDRLVALAVPQTVPQTAAQSDDGGGETASAAPTAAAPTAGERITAALEAQLAAAAAETPPGLVDALKHTSLRVVGVEPVPETGYDEWDDDDQGGEESGGEEAEPAAQTPPAPDGSGGAVGVSVSAGVYRVRLAGRLELNGACDVPRLRAQLTATATQFDDVDDVELFLGDEPLDAVLSLRGLAAGQ